MATTTSNYNLIIAEGTDIVNPLTQIFPNFTALDTDLKAVQNKAVGAATEVKTGTVHAITRAWTASPLFVFTATGAWETGDTMTLDGNSVTVVLSDGTSPKTGAYIIGTEVLGITDGTSVTLIISNDVSEVKEMLNYSTSEHVVGKWIDGSTVYEKTIDVGALPNSAERAIAHGISNLKYVVEIRGVAIRETGPIAYPIPFVRIDSASNNISLVVGDTNINISTNIDYSYMNKCYVTLRYLKTA